MLEGGGKYLVRGHDARAERRFYFEGIVVVGALLDC